MTVILGHGQNSFLGSRQQYACCRNFNFFQALCAVRNSTEIGSGVGQRLSFFERHQSNAARGTGGHDGDERGFDNDGTVVGRGEHDIHRCLFVERRYDGGGFGKR